jgi:N-acetylneuraminic acid mutarotase
LLNPKLIIEPKASIMKENRYSLARAFVAVAALAGLAWTSPIMAQTGKWSEDAPSPVAANSSVAASVNGIVYVAGGNNGNPLSGFYAYNPSSNTWSTLAALPGPRYQMSGFGVISNKIYAVGGWTYSPPLPNNNLWVYDPVLNAWDTSKAGLPRLSGDGAFGVISNKLYVTTPDDGYNGNYNFLDVYDPAGNNWTTLASSPIPHVAPGFGVIGNKLYVAGGNNGSVVSGQLDVYDPVANSWTTKSPMPMPAENTASAVLNGKLYVIGGYDGTNALNFTQVYDPTSDTWSKEAPMITARYGVCAATVNDAIYAVGGVNASNLANTEAFTPFSVSLVSSNDPVILYPYHLAGDGVNLFVTGTGTNSSQFVFKLPETGGAASVVYNAYNPAEIALLGTNMFWIDPNAGPYGDTEILGAPTNGSGPIAKIYIGSNVGQPIVDGVGLTSDGSVLYAADEVNGSVWRLNSDGSGLTQLGPNRYSGYFSTEHYNSIAVNQGLLYIADSGQRAVVPQVISIPTNGGTFTTLASGAPFVNPSGIAIGGGMIFVSDPGASNTIWQLPLGGGTPTVLVSGPPFVSINGLCFVNGTLYVADTGAGAIYAIDLPKPAISVQPMGVTAATGGRAVLTVAANGEPPFTYQWQLNGVNVPGATNSSLVIPGFSAAKAGLYTVIVSNVWGSVTSAAASVASVDIRQFVGVVVNGQPGLNYTVQSSPALGNGAVWTTVTNVTLVTNPYIYIDYTSLTNHQQFFRVLPAP